MLREKDLFHHENFVHCYLWWQFPPLILRAVSKLHPALTFQNSTEFAKYMLPRGGPEKCVRCLCVAGLKCQAQINQSANFSLCLSPSLSVGVQKEKTSVQGPNYGNLLYKDNPRSNLACTMRVVAQRRWRF